MEILKFWFEETPDEKRFSNDPAFDAAIRRRFEDLWRQGKEGALSAWEETPDGALALVILLDQFPRNMFRGTGEAFSSDARAREAAKRAVARGFDMKVDTSRRWFFYMPFMHSEDIADQDECIRLFAQRGDGSGANSYAARHREVIKRFGRFPARNRALGRENTEEEAAFLKENPSGF